MKKLIYLIVAIVALGLIVPGCIPVVPPTEQDEINTLPNRSTLGVPSPYSSIQLAINAAVDGDVIEVVGGTYIESLDINKNITLQGKLGDTVIIDTSLSSDYGLHVYGDYTVILQNFTLIGPISYINGYGIKVSGENAEITIHDVTVIDSGRSGIDLNGVVFGDLKDITTTNNGGVGLALTDCDYITINNIHTSGNGWGGIGIYTKGASYTGGSSNIKLTGTNSFGEFPFPGLYTEIENSGDPSSPYPIINLQIPVLDFGYLVGNNIVLKNFKAYYLDNASAISVALADPNNSYIINRTDNTFLVAPGMSIQAAIDAASDGDIINVAGGIYTENVAVNKQVTLLGANHDVDPVGSSDRGNESVIVGQVTITADDVTVNGFKLTSHYIAAGYDSALNVDISYNILENVEAEWGAIHLHGGTNQCDGAYVGYNTIINADGDGIWTVGNDDVTIEYNHILYNTGDRAIEALNHVGTGIVIHGNIITNSGGKGINYWAEDGGVITDNVITNSKHEAIYTDAQATISGNQISGGDMYGILVVGGATGSTVSGNTISNTNWEGIQSNVSVTITDNDISGGYNGIQLSNAASSSVINGNNIHDNQYWGLSIQPSVIDVTVQNNQLTNNPYCGVIVWGDGEGYGIHINLNNITGNGIYGVESKRTTSDVDATCNWWGDNSGPGAVGPGDGDKVSANVDYNPWQTRDSTLLVYTPEPQPVSLVVLEAKLSSDSTSNGISGMDVDFYYLNGDNVGTAITGEDGVAKLELDPYVGEAGVYEVYATICDLDSLTVFLVVYDPSAGFVTGGGWIDSPLGAYTANPSLTGKATFGFVSKYKKGATVPTGNTEFQFKAGDLNFHSDSYDWLVIAGEKAKYKGTGTINGAGEYGFMLTATDSDTDLFRIKIQDKTTDTVIYDNKMDSDDTEYDGTELGGGQIIVHKGK